MYTFCLHSADGICIFAATSEVIYGEGIDT